MQNKPKIINSRLDGAKWCLVAHGGRAKRAACASHVQAMRNQAPSGTTVSVFHDLRLVLHVGNTLSRFVTVVEACGDPHIPYIYHI